MSRRKIPLITGNYYHIFNRGHNRLPIYFERENYLFFLRRLRKYLIEPEPKTKDSPQAGVKIIAYCLMPNHFHLLVQALDDHTSDRMKRFSISYTRAINEQQGRIGALYQGLFKAVLVDKNDYLLHLSRYIHLNPYSAGLVKKAEEWEFSSYPEYIGMRPGTLPSPEIVLSQFGGRDEYRVYVESYKASDRGVIDHLLFEE